MKRSGEVAGLVHRKPDLVAGAGGLVGSPGCAEISLAILWTMIMEAIRQLRTLGAKLLAAAWLAPIACALLGGCAAIPHRTGPIVKNDYRFLGEYLDWMIDQEARKNHVQGVSIAVVDGSRVVWSRGYGWADAERRIPATPDTLFRVGSVSKLLTATEIMRRVDRGEIELDSEVVQHLPAFRVHSRFTDPKPITVRSLLSHHSGLPRDYMFGMWTDQHSDLAKLVRDLAEDSLVEAPQTRFRYSSVGY